MVRTRTNVRTFRSVSRFRLRYPHYNANQTLKASKKLFARDNLIWIETPSHAGSYWIYWYLKWGQTQTHMSEKTVKNANRTWLTPESALKVVARSEQITKLPGCIPQKLLSDYHANIGRPQSETSWVNGSGAAPKLVRWHCRYHSFSAPHALTSTSQNMHFRSQGDM